MASKRTGRGTILFGLLVLLAGIAGAVGLFMLSQQRRDDAIRNLARASVGCKTTMLFKDTGTFYVYLEHLGKVETLEGTCSGFPEEYSRGADDEPVVEITVVDGDENVVELDRLEDEFTYALDDSYAGTAKRQVEIESRGDYIVDVNSADNDFVVAVGRDPADAATTARLGALASGIAGIVLGLVLVLVGVRRARRWRRVETVFTARPPGWPAGAPLATAPPVTQPPRTQPMPPPGQPGQWSPARPVGPPILSPAQPPPPGPYASPAGPVPGPFAPPSVFAPPERPTRPATPPSHNPVAPASPAADGRDDGGELRGDA